MSKYKTAGMVVLLIIGWVTVSAAVPGIINYQGKINSEGTPYSGMGYFRFALVDATGATIYWTNDGSNPITTNVQVEVNNGLYSVMLGYSDGMVPIPGSVFTNEDVYLRIWFDDGINGMEQLVPDQRLGSSGYALIAETAFDADTVDGVHAADLEESSEITAGISAHAAIPDSHHAKTTSFTELTDSAMDAQIPDDISISNGTLHAMGTGNVGIKTSNPLMDLHVAGNIMATDVPEYYDNYQAVSAGLPTGAFYHTGDLLKIVHATPTITPTNLPTETPTATPTMMPTITPTETPSAGYLVSTDPIVGNMRYIPSGTFTQGSPSDEPGRGPNESPQFTHTLSRNLAVMETEITRQMWADLLSMQPSLPSDPTDLNYGSGMNNPVQNNTWYEAVLFANLLSIQNSYTQCYYTTDVFTPGTEITASNYTAGPFYCDFDADGYRLATEGEWEYFTRAGITGPFSSIEPNYSSSTCNTCYPSPALEVLNSIAWWCATGAPSNAVGLKDANPWNLKDVHGNVWEWCWDWYDATYPSGLVTDYTGPASGSSRAGRGGSWNFFARFCRSAQRDGNGPSSRLRNLGFRLGRTIP
ncbi:formylglycine-generating enzyme family protein [bacterium]|nr:formylglycine-generating enzyme family protein [candidate division CSSED10-310 bacterium]